MALTLVGGGGVGWVGRIYQLAITEMPHRFVYRQSDGGISSVELPLWLWLCQADKNEPGQYVFTSVIMRNYLT